jgi:hypothetical protein
MHRHTTNTRPQEELITPIVQPVCLIPPSLRHQRDQAETANQERWLPLPLLGNKNASIFLPPLSTLNLTVGTSSPVSIVWNGADCTREFSKAPVTLSTRVRLPLRVYQRAPSRETLPLLVAEKRKASMAELPLLPKLCELEHGATQGHYLSLPKTRLQPKFPL